MLNIRTAGTQDMSTVFELIMAEARHHGAIHEVRTSAAELRNAAACGKLAVLLAEYDGEPAGYVSYTVNYSIWLGADFMMIDDVFVVERFRGQKIGEALMLRAREIAAAAGYPRIRWGVESSNAGAIRFYKRLGAVPHTKDFCTWTV